MTSRYVASRIFVNSVVLLCLVYAMLHGGTALIVGVFLYSLIRASLVTLGVIGLLKLRDPQYSMSQVALDAASNLFLFLVVAILNNGESIWLYIGGSFLWCAMMLFYYLTRKL